MDIIEFPIKGRKKTDDLGLVVEKINTGEHAPLHGPWEFTCVDCQHKTQFTTSGMIFKVLEFFCVKCGRLYKVSNPAFKTKPQRIPDPKNIRKILF